MILLTLDDHRSITMSSEVSKICNPLFKNSPIDYFFFEREFFHGDRYIFGTDQNWLMNHYAKKYYQNNIENFEESYTSEVILTDILGDCPMSIDARDNFKINHTLVMNKMYQNRIEFFYFATKNENDSINNWYINNLGFLKKFILFFLEKSDNLTRQCKPYFPDVQSNTLVEEYKRVLQLSKSTPAADFSIEKWQNFNGNEKIVLNKREISVAQEIIKGRSCKAIARDLNLSPRTVEYYLNKLKIKFDCATKSSLIDKIYKTGFCDDFLL